MLTARIRFDSFFTGVDFPHAALEAIKSAVRRRTLDLCCAFLLLCHLFTCSSLEGTLIDYRVD